MTGGRQARRARRPSAAGTRGRAPAASRTRRREIALERRGALWAGTFEAMASPCEVLVDGASREEALRLATCAAEEAWRIERTFSRYRDDNVVHRINTGAGRPLDVDPETARLLDFADRCHALSDGLFDITSGVLRRVWTFDGSSTLPDAADVEALLAHVGWHRVSWEAPRLVLPAGMQIDFGGIGKEYAVDRVLGLLRGRSARPLLVNFGGDLHASGPPASAAAWRVGIEAACTAACTAGETPEAGTLELRRGAMASSGDARRHVSRDGVRYGHVLSPLTGWPVPDAPRSVTVAADSCTQAGLLSTLALLHGAGAEALLEGQGLPYRCQRERD